MSDAPPTTQAPDGNPYYPHTEEWLAYQSGILDVVVRIDARQPISEINEDHLVMLGQAYVAGVRYQRQKHRG